METGMSATSFETLSGTSSKPAENGPADPQVTFPKNAKGPVPQVRVRAFVVVLVRTD